MGHTTWVMGQMGQWTMGQFPYDPLPALMQLAYLI